VRGPAADPPRISAPDLAIPPPRADWLLRIGVAIVGVVCLLALIGPHVGPNDPTLTTPRVVVPPPGLADIPALAWGQITGTLDHPPHWFGTDASGYDVFWRVIAAPRTDLVIALSANGLSLVPGVFLGLIAGYFHNGATGFLMRVTDVMQSFPVFINAMVLVALAGRSTANIVIALAFVYTPI